MSDGGWARGERACVAAFSAAMLGAVLSPLSQYRRPLRERVDGFPLSWYPMFSTRRRRRARITYAVGVRADGSRSFLPFAVLGPAGLNQVRRQLYRVAVTEGRPDDYATTLARRLADGGRCPDVVRVEVVRGRFDLDRSMLDDVGLLERIGRGEEIVLASAPVERERA